MKKQRHTLGREFRQFASIFDAAEEKYAKRVNMNWKLCGPSFGWLLHEIHKDSDRKASSFITSILPMWADSAKHLRESFKFKTEEEPLYTLSGASPAEVYFNAPFPNTVLVLDFDGKLSPTVQQYKSLVVFCEHRYWIESDPLTDQQRKAYKDVLNIEDGNGMYALVGALFTHDHGYMDGWNGIVPIEIHIKQGDFIPLAGTNPIPHLPAFPHGMPDDKDTFDKFATLGQIMTLSMQRLIRALAIPQANYPVTPGIKPGVRLNSKKHKYVMYEHTVLTLEPLKTVQQKGQFCVHGRKHRMHSVRGHRRTYKNGKSVWVKEHWRGDKELGVITHDYNVKYRERLER